MYSKHENPILKASIFYYDDTYDEMVSAKVLSILKDFGMYPPEKIYAGKLTNNRYIKADLNAESLFIKAYSEKDVMSIDMASNKGKINSDFWRFTWDFTFYKDSKADLSEVVFKPWNIISLSSTYGRLKDNKIYFNFINCVKRIISEIKPFYAIIDDVDNSVKKSGTLGRRFDEKILPSEIYWGNYWNNQYVSMANAKAFEYLLQNGAICEEIDNGLYFSLSDSAFDFENKHIIHMERQFIKFLL